MKIPAIETVETKEQGHNLAVEWQYWQSDQSLSWGEISYWQVFFVKVAEKFPSLAEEFRENGII